MNLSVLIPWDQRTTDADRIVTFGWLLKRYEMLLPDAQICIGKNADEPFSRSRARNDAFEQATGDILLIADADTMFDPLQIAAAADFVFSGDSWMLPYGSYYNMDRATSRRVILQRPDTDIARLGLPPEEYEHKIEDSPAGLLVMKSEHFVAVNGYDERFVAWGGEDNSFRMALETLVGKVQRLPEFDCYHLWHPVVEGTTFDSPYWANNAKLLKQYKSACGNPEAMKEVIS